MTASWEGKVDGILPFVGPLFVFILALNLGWVIPGVMPPTTDLMTTAALGLTTVALVQLAIVRAKGVIGYLRHLAQPTVVMIPMNIIEELVKPFSLAIRLFGNMFGEEMVVTILFFAGSGFGPDTGYGSWHLDGQHSSLHLYSADHHVSSGRRSISQAS